MHATGVYAGWTWTTHMMQHGERRAHMHCWNTNVSIVQYVQQSNLGDVGISATRQRMAYA